MVGSMEVTTMVLAKSRRRRRRRREIKKEIGAGVFDSMGVAYES